jgi:integrase
MFSRWADRPIREINMDKVITLFDEKSKTGQTQTNTAFRILRSLLNYAQTAYRDAEDKPLFYENPVNILTARGRWNPSRAKNDRVPINKIGEVWNLLQEHRGEPTYDCVSFILLTGCRRGEAEKLEWRNVDFKNELWTIENSKSNTDRTLPLSKQAVELLRARKELAINEYVFSGLISGHVKEIKRVTRKISEIAETKITPHDLRRTFVSIADSLKIDFLSVKLLLNHSIGSDVTLRHYSQTTVLDKLKPEIDSIGNWIERQGRLAANKVVDISTAGKAL